MMHQVHHLTMLLMINLQEKYPGYFELTCQLNQDVQNMSSHYESTFNLSRGYLGLLLEQSSLTNYWRSLGTQDGCKAPSRESRKRESAICAAIRAKLTDELLEKLGD